MAKRLSRSYDLATLLGDYQLARVLLADEGDLSLNKKQVAHIFEVLDHPPPKRVCAIRKLLTEKTILEG